MAEKRNNKQDENKYEKALSLYNCEVSDEEVRDAVRKIIAEKVHENDNLEVKKFLMGSVELTTLKTTDSEDSVLAFTERVNMNIARLSADVENIDYEVEKIGACPLCGQVMHSH